MTKTAAVKSSEPKYLIGYAYDVHNVVKSYGFGPIVAGVKLNLPLQIEAHSDGDVVFHALSNAILGALGLGDIGFYFPDDDEKTKGMDSAAIVGFAVGKMRTMGYCLSNLDIQVVSDDVMIAKSREIMIARISELTGCNRVNIKGTRWEFQHIPMRSF